MKAKITTISLAAFTALLVVWVALVSFDWVQEYFATKQNSAYQELPFEFKLKVDPEDVIFSEAYTTSDGKDIVKYAYVAGESGPQLNEDISRRTPESYTEVIDEFKNEDGDPMETLKTTFMSKPQFYQKEGKWRQIEYATTTPEILAMSGAIPYIKKREFMERLVPGYPVFATVSTFNPDANTENNSVDGYASMTTYSSQVTANAACVDAWSQARSGVGIGSDDVTNALAITAYSYDVVFANPDWDCYIDILRAFVLFNTATLPDDASITASDFKLYVIYKGNGDNDGSDTINIVSSAPVSSTAIVAGDYDSLGTTLYATAADITSVSTGGYLTFALNGTGLAAVSKTGVTKFGVREGHDLANTRIANSTSNDVGFSSADETGTSQDPVLEVTYTVSATFSFGMWFPF